MYDIIIINTTMGCDFMKKTILCFAATVLITKGITNITAISAPGDIIRPIYSTDILTYMDGIPIQGYSLNGRMMIELEALESYGFSVSYDESVRTLFVNKTNKPYENFHPHYSRDVEGNIVGYTYETDIKAYVNGNYIPTESVNGRLLAVAENLGRVIDAENDYDIDTYGQESKSVFELYGQYGTSPYFMTHHWNSVARTLHVYNNVGSLPPYEEQVSKLKKTFSESTKAKTLKYEFKTKYGTLLIGDEATYFIWPDGKYTSLNDVFNLYGLAFEGNIRIQNASLGETEQYVEFDSFKSHYNSLIGHGYDIYDEGRYRFDLKNFIIEKIY